MTGSDHRAARHTTYKASRRHDAPAPHTGSVSQKAQEAAARLKLSVLPSLDGEAGAAHPGAAEGQPQQAQPAAAAPRAQAHAGAHAQAAHSQQAQDAANAPGHGTVRAGYRAPVRNPYVQGQGNIGRAAYGLKPVWDKDENRRQKKGAARRALLIVVCVFAVVLGIWLFAWCNRSVTFKINGSEVTAKVGTSLEQVVADKGLSFTPGNLVAVDGEVLGEGQGRPFSVKQGDTELSWDQVQALHMEGGEDLTLGNGENVMEPATTTVKETQPKLLMEGAWGSVAYVSQWGKPGKQEVLTGQTSGKTADGKVLQEVQDCVVTVRNVSPADDKKLVALTFDDGPSAYTQKYLDILASYGAKATFFNLGSNVQEDPAQAKAIVDSGNQLASHTQSHEQLTTLDAQQLQQELRSGFEQIKNATGLSTTVIRPPYGDFRERTWLDSGGLMSASILWTQDSEDWRLPGVDSIVANSLAGVTSGSIILMHDGGGNRDQDLAALPKIIESLQADGYTLVTVDELLASDPTIPADIASGDATMPEGCVWPTELGDA